MVVQRAAVTGLFAVLVVGILVYILTEGTGCEKALFGKEHATKIGAMLFLENIAVPDTPIVEQLQFPVVDIGNSNAPFRMEDDFAVGYDHSGGSNNWPGIGQIRRAPGWSILNENLSNNFNRWRFAAIAQFCEKVTLVATVTCEQWNNFYESNPSTLIETKVLAGFIESLLHHPSLNDINGKNTKASKQSQCCTPYLLSFPGCILLVRTIEILNYTWRKAGLYPNGFIGDMNFFGMIAGSFAIFLAGGLLIFRGLCLR